MNKILKTIIFTAVLCLGLRALGYVTLAATAATPLSDFTSGQPAILANNPFYGLKSSFQKFFAGSSISGALDLVNERAAEVFMADVVAPEDDRLILKSLRNYRDSAQVLANRLAKVTPNSFIEERLGETLLTHWQFTDDLAPSRREFSQVKIIGETQEQLAKALIILAGGLAEPGEFSSQVLASLKAKDAFESLRLAEAILNFSKALYRQKDAELSININKLLAQILEQTNQKLEALSKSAGEEKITASLIDLAGEPLNHLLVLAHLNEYLALPELRNAVSRARLELELNLEPEELVDFSLYARQSTNVFLYDR